MSDSGDVRASSRAKSQHGQDEEAMRRFRRSWLSDFQARRIRIWLTLVGKRIFGFKVEVEGLEHVPKNEPLIVAAAPHRNWIDPFLILLALPSLPRLYFVAASDTPGNRWWKRLAIEIAGGMAPVTTRGSLNRDGLEISLAILAEGNRLGIFPEGWGNNAAPFEVLPLKRGVAFLSEHSGRRVLPIGLSGTTDLYRGATLRVRVAPPFDALPLGADRNAEQQFVERLHVVLQEAVPPPPPEIPDDKKRWRWLTRMI